MISRSDCPVIYCHSPRYVGLFTIEPSLYNGAWPHTSRSRRCNTIKPHVHNATGRGDPRWIITILVSRRKTPDVNIFTRAVPPSTIFWWKDESGEWAWNPLESNHRCWREVENERDQLVSSIYAGTNCLRYYDFLTDEMLLCRIVKEVVHLKRHEISKLLKK